MGKLIKEWVKGILTENIEKKVVSIDIHFNQQALEKVKVSPYSKSIYTFESSSISNDSKQYIEKLLHSYYSLLPLFSHHQKSLSHDQKYRPGNYSFLK